MGFISDNTNTVEIYLTDLGRQVFLQGGLQSAMKYFSISDEGSNYYIFMPDTTTVLDYDSTLLSSYVAGDIVKYSGRYYRFRDWSGSRTSPSTLGWWEEIFIFNPTTILPQAIPVIDNLNNLKTSLGEDGGSAFVSDVFTQVALRGNIINNKGYDKALTSTKNNTLRSYVFHEPDPDTGNVVTTYIIR